MREMKFNFKNAIGNGLLLLRLFCKDKTYRRHAVILGPFNVLWGALVLTAIYSLPVCLFTWFAQQFELYELIFGFCGIFFIWVIVCAVALLWAFVRVFVHGGISNGKKGQ